MPRVELERDRELRERFVRLVDVVVTHAEIGAHVHVGRRQLQRIRIPLDRIVVPLGIEEQVPELRARRRVARFALGHSLQRVHLGVVEHGRAGGRRAGCRSGRRRLLRDCRRDRARRLQGLLRPDDPAGDQTEQDSRDPERDGVILHEA